MRMRSSSIAIDMFDQVTSIDIIRTYRALLFLGLALRLLRRRRILGGRLLAGLGNRLLSALGGRLVGRDGSVSAGEDTRLRIDGGRRVGLQLCTGSDRGRRLANGGNGLGVQLGQQRYAELVRGHLPLRQNNLHRQLLGLDNLNVLDQLVGGIQRLLDLLDGLLGLLYSLQLLLDRALGQRLGGNLVPLPSAWPSSQTTLAPSPESCRR